jgi:hypothetical protein
MAMAILLTMLVVISALEHSSRHHTPEVAKI